MQQRTDKAPERWPFSSFFCLLEPQLKVQWSQWKGDFQETIYKEGQLGENAKVFLITQELDLKSGAFS